MSERILLGGTDGFRGPATTVAGPGLINEETFAIATYALVGRQLELGHMGPVVIGQDTRESGRRLREASIQGALLHTGIEVVDLGIAPTPAIQKISQEIGGIATIAVTASHNSKEDNGWKGMVGSEKPAKDIVKDISDRYWGYVDSGLAVPAHSANEATEQTELLSWYSELVIADIEREFGAFPLEGALFVIDGAYGAGQTFTPAIFRRLGATVEEYCCDGSGSINDGCGATNLDGLKDFLAGRSDIILNPNFVGALANDGDADRVMAVGVRSTNNNVVEPVEVNGNHAMGAYALGELGIVGTEYTNSGLVQALKQQGIGFEHCKNGDIFVTERLKEKQAQGNNWRRGGEFTGHHVDTDWLSSGDGVRMAAWLAAYAVKNQQTFGDVYENLPLWKEVMAKVKLPASANGSEILKASEVSRVLLKAEEQLGSNGRLVVRPSGTEPVIRIWGEGKQQNGILTAVSDIETVIKTSLAITN